MSIDNWNVKHSIDNIDNIVNQMMLWKYFLIGLLSFVHSP